MLKNSCYFTSPSHLLLFEAHTSMATAKPKTAQTGQRSRTTAEKKPGYPSRLHMFYKYEHFTLVDQYHNYVRNQKLCGRIESQHSCAVRCFDRQRCRAFLFSTKMLSNTSTCCLLYKHLTPADVRQERDFMWSSMFGGWDAREVIETKLYDAQYKVHGYSIPRQASCSGYRYLVGESDGRFVSQCAGSCHNTSSCHYFVYNYKACNSRRGYNCCLLYEKCSLVKSEFDHVYAERWGKKAKYN